MKEKSIEELQKELAETKALLARMSKTVQENDRVLEVLIAAGLLDRDKLDQAREIVRDLKD